MTWRWIDKSALLLLHDESLAEHGGAAGIRDEELLDDALARPVSLATGNSPDYAALAACYAVSLASHHPFIDGNSRVALLATGLFLHLNGYKLTATAEELMYTMLALAAGEEDEDTFAGWLRGHSAKR
ncbi:MAG: type II toxin-antitoxin system death-on-curing family toxin [Burkholderiales bacterium]|nr:type II toxin-antitoxin system death-on-curing family toxin [Burkholderiales bacterium]